MPRMPRHARRQSSEGLYFLQMEGLETFEYVEKFARHLPRKGVGAFLDV